LTGSGIKVVLKPLLFYHKGFILVLYHSEVGLELCCEAFELLAGHGFVVEESADFCSTLEPVLGIESFG
jgi:hypothetical protein